MPLYPGVVILVALAGPGLFEDGHLFSGEIDVHFRSHVHRVGDTRIHRHGFDTPRFQIEKTSLESAENCGWDFAPAVDGNCRVPPPPSPPRPPRPPRPVVESSE